MSSYENCKPIINEYNFNNLSENEKNNLKIHYLKTIRSKRNELLLDTDKYLLADYPITSNNLLLIKEYRQKLRDYMSIDEIKNFNYFNNMNVPDFPIFPF